MTFPILCFAIGVWLLQQQPVLPHLAWAWTLILFPLALLIPANIPVLRLARMLMLAAFALGAGYFHAAWQAQHRLAVTLPATWQGRDIEVIGVVSGLPHIVEHGQRFYFDVEQTLTPGVTVPDHVYLSTYDSTQAPSPTVHAGERWRFTLRLKQPHGSSNPYGFDFELWSLENNIRATGYVNNRMAGERLTVLATGLKYRIDSWRESVRDSFNTALADAPYVGVLDALAIGDQGSIPQDQWQVFTRTGVSHLMSISGLHITMLSGLGFALAYWLWRRSARLTLFLPARKAAASIALFVALGYALLSGFAVPAQRTVYMAGAVTAALWLNRNFSIGQILGIALLGVLVPDPWAVTSPGFWLSFGAVTLILYVTAYRLAASTWLIEYARVQWAMTIGLTPLLLGLFHQVSLVSPIANAFAIPLVSLVVVPLTLLGAILSPAWSWNIPLWLAHKVMEWTMTMLVWLNQLPQAVWAQHAPPVWSIATGMLGALVILLPRGFPARWLGILLLLPMFMNAPALPKEDSVRVTFFDVGQGLAVSVQTHRHTLLYDAGPDFSDGTDSGSRIVVPSLHAMGISKLDGIILTHDDTDHTGGALSVLQAIPAAWLLSSLPEDHPLMHQLEDNRRCMDGQSWKWDGVDFEILHPDAASYSDRTLSDNNRGCVLRISTGDQHILLAADIEKESERQLLSAHRDKLPAALLLVPHHGSATSSTADFVGSVHPGYAIFTNGYLNRFGHPRPDIVERYRQTGARLLRSDDDGAIIVEMSHGGLSVESYRKSHQHYWSHPASRDYPVAPEERR